jgi:DNA-binding NarL/FixJ family response regulator
MRSRVLVVEDEPLVAIDIASVLENFGYEVVGPAGTAAAALSLLASEGCDAAILDIRLGQETSQDVALELAQGGVPFVILPAYSPKEANFPSDAPALAKPLQKRELLAELQRDDREVKRCR